MAAYKANEKSECHEDYYFVFKLRNNEIAIINANKNTEKRISFIKNNGDLPEPRSEIDIDHRYLFGLLTHIYHWNNAEIGSQYNTRRFPNKFNRSAQTFFNYFTL